MSAFRPLHVAFVIEHAYVNALACFREPIKALAARGAHVDVYTRLTTTHPAPVFASPRVRVIPVDITYSGAAALAARLATHRPRYAAVLAAPQWGLHWAVRASAVTGAPVGYISDELIIDSELATSAQRRWKMRERLDHQAVRLLDRTVAGPRRLPPRAESPARRPSDLRCPKQRAGSGPAPGVAFLSGSARHTREPAGDRACGGDGVGAGRGAGCGGGGLG